MMNKRQFVFVCLSLLASISISQPLVRAADALEGHVQERTVRIVRPNQPANEVQPSLSGVVSDESFQLDADGSASPGQLAPIATPIHQGKIEQTALKGSTAQAELAGASQAGLMHHDSRLLTARTSNHGLSGAADKEGGSASGKGGVGVVDDYNARRPLTGSVTFRFCYYDLGDGAECAWEGLRDAVYLQGRNVDIAIMLDRGGVRLANRHNGHEYQLHRGSTERQVKTQQMLREFIDKGGKVYASERWARTFGLIGGSYPALTGGVELLGDEDMAEMLVERSGRIVEY